MEFSLPLLVIFFLLFKLITSRCTSPSRTNPPILRLPPGPWQLPLIGNLPQGPHDLPHRALRELSQSYGPLMLLRLGAVPTLVVSSAEAAREVMRTHDLAFCSRHLSATIGILN
ncbi:hypothetical protein SETIT_9G176700v2 [Setaria italica]|uniref:Uncharacterized protein n=1 Tax=Setaria italica TaxID=4555 RepID=K4AIW9_SETIT|nr:hypothetical protein SETIT_9G176700v2 [Setaria italica]